MALRKLSSDPLRESMTASLSTSLPASIGGGPSPDPGRTPERRDEDRGLSDPRLPLPVILGASLLLHLLLFAVISALPREARSLEPYQELALDLLELPVEPEVAPPEPEQNEPEPVQPEPPEPEPQAAIVQEPEPEIDRPEPEQDEAEQDEPEQDEPEQDEEPPPAAEEPHDAPEVMTAGAEEAAPNAGSVYSGHGGPGGEPGGTGEGTTRREGSPDGVPGGTGTGRPRASRAEMVAALRAYRAQLVRFLRGRVRYPRAARRAGEQGTVLLSVRLRPDGHILEVRLVDSSGASSLDDAALEGVRQVTQAPPLPEILPQREGSVRVPIIFELTEL